MSTVLKSKSPVPETLEEIIQRGKTLYSLPAVAAEVIQLTNNPQVDTLALKECIELDPALTAKLLRVVNSSLFGLSREVNDLNQAIALLGTKPLKLLVLGFSLPEELFCRVARDQLQWYWNSTLCRAVAAREISEHLWKRPGDDAFLAGLLQDLGILVLLGQLKQPYAKFLDNAIQNNSDLQQLEIESLGFGHTDLTAMLLDHWQMPKLLVESISEPHNKQRLSREKTPAFELAKILHLADLFTELTAQHRLDVLPELIETGETYCDLDKNQLHEIVALLQPKVEQLAEVLSLEICDSDSYSSILTVAHERMSLLAEGVAAPLSRQPTESSTDPEVMLQDASQLQFAVKEFLNSSSNEVSIDSEDSITAKQESTVATTKATNVEPDSFNFKDLAAKLTLAVGNCRSTRQPLSVSLIDVACKENLSNRNQQLITHILNQSCGKTSCENLEIENLAPLRRMLILPGYERQEAVASMQSILEDLEALIRRLNLTLDCKVDAGVATVAMPSKNFPPLNLLDTSRRCLAAAQSSDSNVVKSLEIY